MYSLDVGIGVGSARWVSNSTMSLSNFRSSTARTRMSKSIIRLASGAFLVVFLTALWVAYLFLPASGTGRAIDGDSLMLGDVEYRLWGIQAPEMDDPQGASAYLALKSQIDGKLVTCRRRQLWRSYDRIVARCSTRELRDVAAWLVGAGHAEDWAGFSGGKYRQ